MILGYHNEKIIQQQIQDKGADAGGLKIENNKSMKFVVKLVMIYFIGKNIISDTPCFGMLKCTNGGICARTTYGLYKCRCPSDFFGSRQVFAINYHFSNK